jgi:alkylhydroperoxidase family enzyme
LKGNEVITAVLADYRTAPINEKLRAMLAFIERLNFLPGEVRGEELAPVLAAGATKAGIREALHVVAVFSLLNRLADAFGFAIPDEAGLDATGKMLVRLGYRL